jgi:hypothetical protein
VVVLKPAVTCVCMREAHVRKKRERVLAAAERTGARVGTHEEIMNRHRVDSVSSQLHLSTCPHTNSRP